MNDLSSPMAAMHLGIAAGGATAAFSSYATANLIKIFVGIQDNTHKSEHYTRELCGMMCDQQRKNNF